MNRTHLPGLPAVATLTLATIPTVWLGLWGPVGLEKLKAWQPLMAALIALGAGALACRGAMAKIDRDRSIHEDQH